MNTSVLKQIMGHSHRAALWTALAGEEKEFFAAKIESLVKTFLEMPATYQTDGQGSAAVAQLHYFIGGCDWWIVEKDADPDGEGQIQAFGLADLGMGRELGYISIPELLANGAELDLYFTPRKVADITAEKGL